ncbi:MAG: hypothetical protein IPM16_01360 [Chloroflexi bacterium]|nr:hypothetical protein [Chloroflexota bacterium]
MADRLRLTVRALTEVVLAVEDARVVRCMLTDGAIAILPRHAPLLGELAAYGIEWDDDAGTHSLSVNGGILSVRDGEVVILLGTRLDASESTALSRLARASLSDPARAAMREEFSP